jgi:carboxylesterase
MRKESRRNVAQLLRGAGSYFFEGSPVGCLLVHGMGSTPYQVRSLGEYLAWQGLNVLGIRLPGHGTTLDELEQTTAGQWLSAIDDGIDQLQQTCSHIFVIGTRWEATWRCRLQHGEGRIWQA